MEDTHALIKNIGIDIIAITAIWGLMNISYQSPKINYNDEFIHSNFFYYYKIFVGTGITLYLIRKYN